MKSFDYHKYRAEAKKQIRQFLLINHKVNTHANSVAKFLIENEQTMCSDNEQRMSIPFLRTRIDELIEAQASISNEKASILKSVVEDQLSAQLNPPLKDSNDTFDPEAERLSNHVSTVVERTIKLCCSAKPEDSQFRLSCIFLFAAVFGGLCHLPSQKVLLRKIAMDKKPFTQNSTGVYVNLHFNDATYQTNEHDENGKCITVKRWFIDELTLSAVIGFLSIRRSNEKCDTQPKLLLGTLLTRCDMTHKFKNVSPQLFLKACALYLFRNRDAKLSYTLRNYATGLINSASISTICYESLNRQTLQKRIFKCEQLDQTLPKSKSRNRVTTRVSSSKSFNSQIFTKDLYQACKSINEDGHKRSVKEALFALSQVRAKYNHLTHGAEIFEAWVCHNLQSRNWVNSTAERYNSAICSAWLDAVEEQDLEEPDGADIQELYEHISNNRASEDAQAPDALRRLFLFANEQFGVALPDLFEGTNNGAAHVRSQIISEYQFQTLRSDMNIKYKNETLAVQQSIDIALILCRRLFMRPSEVFRLLVKDVENSCECWIRVRANCWKSLKTSSAGRKLPVKLLLLTEEFIRFKDFLKTRRLETENRDGALLFSLLPIADSPFSIPQISKSVGELLTAYVGEPTRLYSLRHAGISNLQLTLCAEQDLNNKYNFYSETQIKDIKRHLKCDDADKYYEIAKLAGHLSPQITLSTYAHFSEHLLYQSVKKISPCLSHNIWNRLLNVRPSTIRKALNTESDDIELSSKSLEGFIATRMRPFCSKLLETQSSNASYLEMPPVSVYLSIHMAHKILQKFDSGMSPTEIHYEVPLPINTITSVIESAAAIKNRYITTRGASRLYPQKSMFLAPSLPPSNVEKSDLTRMQKIFEQQKLSSKPFKLAIDYALKNTSHDHPGINFSELNYFKSFMSEMADLLPHSNLYVTLSPQHMRQDECLKEWQKAVKRKVHVLPKCKKNKNLFPLGQLTVHYLHSDHEEMISSHKGDLSMSKYGSNTLRFALHMFAILLGSEKRLAANMLT